MSIPPPGVPRTIPDLNPNVLESLKEVMDDDGEEESSLDENKATLLGDELASKLSEPKTDLMVGIIEIFGVEIVVELFKKSQDIETNVSPYLTLRFYIKLTFKISNSVRFYDLSFQFENCRSFVTVHFIKNPRTHLFLKLLKVNTMSSSKTQNSNNFPRFTDLKFMTAQI